MARYGATATILRGIGLAMRTVAYRVDAGAGKLLRANAFKEPVTPLQPMQRFCGCDPNVHLSCFVAPNATITGQAFIGPRSALFYHASIVADLLEVHIGAETTVMEHCVVRCAPNFQTRVGSNCVIEPRCTLTGCTVGDGAFIGAGATLLEGSTVEPRAIVAPGSRLLRFAVVPTGELWAGSPAQKIRDLTPEEQQAISAAADDAVVLGGEHKTMTEAALSCTDMDGLAERAWADLQASADQRPPSTGTAVAVQA